MCLLTSAEARIARHTLRQGGPHFIQFSQASFNSD